MRRAALPRSSSIALALVALIALAGCDRLPPPPAVTSVTPSSALEDQSTLVQVSGRDFSVRVFTDFDDPKQSSTDDVYEISIGGLSLTGIQHLSISDRKSTRL